MQNSIKATAWAKPSRSQAVSGSFGLAWGLTKPKPPRARPKPGFPGQAGQGVRSGNCWDMVKGGRGGPTSCLIKNFQTYFFWLFYHLNKFLLIFWAISEVQTTYFCPNYMDRAELTSIETSADPDKRRKFFSKRLTSCWTVKMPKSSKKAKSVRTSMIQFHFVTFWGLYTPPLILAEYGGLCRTQIPECVGVTQAKFEF